MANLMRQSAGGSDIRVRLENGHWVPARPYQAEAFLEFVNRTTNPHEDPIYYDKVIDGQRYTFAIKKEPDQQIYLIREDGTKMPIYDFNDIRVRLVNGDWVPARPYQAEAFLEFANRTTNPREAPINYDKVIDGERYKFTIKRELDDRIYLIRENGSKMPIVDWNDVKIFLEEDWYPALNYQTWAYFNFIYSDDTERNYVSQGSMGLNPNINFTTIKIPNLEPNIVFKICRDNDRNVFYETNDGFNKTGVLISNNPLYREGKLALFSKISINADSPIPPVATAKIPPVATAKIPPVATAKIPPVATAKIPPIATTTITSVPKIGILHPPSGNWFECAFGFVEQNYHQTKARFERMLVEGGNTHLNGIKIGNFEILNGQQLKARLPAILTNGIVTLENIVGDIQSIHQKADYSTIQVASQFNCLEMANQYLTPENGITIYRDDKTQGPICAMSAPAGLAYRNYLYNGGQTSSNQIDMISKLLEYLKTFDNTINWTMQNGYLMINDPQMLRKINSVLIRHPDIRRTARSIIKSGSHTDQGVFIGCKEYEHTVNHVYCSGLPISYNNIPRDMWDGLSEIVLEAMYENTLMIAYLNNLRTGKDNPCYLTKIGGGVFGMKRTQIIRAIQRACNVVAKAGLNLNVKIVHYLYIEDDYPEMPLEYPLSGVTIASVWDDPKWKSENS